VMLERCFHADRSCHRYIVKEKGRGFHANTK